MEFQEYIDKIGAAKLSQMLQCTEANVYKWRNLKGIPKPETAYKLIVISGGQLSFDRIFMPYLSQQLKGTKLRIPSFDGKSEMQLEFNF